MANPPAPEEDREIVLSDNFPNLAPLGEFLSVEAAPEAAGADTAPTADDGAGT